MSQYNEELLEAHKVHEHSLSEQVQTQRETTEQAIAELEKARALIGELERVLRLEQPATRHWHPDVTYEPNPQPTNSESLNVEQIKKDMLDYYEGDTMQIPV